jgi:hypothetical protein
VPRLGTLFARILLEGDLVRSLLGFLLLFLAIFPLITGIYLFKVAAEIAKLVV